MIIFSVTFPPPPCVCESSMMEPNLEMVYSKDKTNWDGIENTGG